MKSHIHRSWDFHSVSSEVSFDNSTFPRFATQPYGLRHHYFTCMTKMGKVADQTSLKDAVSSSDEFLNVETYRHQFTLLSNGGNWAADAIPLRRALTLLVVYCKSELLLAKDLSLQSFCSGV